jgi:Transport and Golgi organisation 2
MCTLTLLRPAADCNGPLFRVVFSRDEQRARPLARAPEVHTAGAVRTLHPVDPQGGGTWIAATEHGLVLALLNGNEAPALDAGARAARRSRGGIIPALAAAGVRNAVDVHLDVDPRAYAPFHLVIADSREIVDVTSDGCTLVCGAPRAGDWLMRTSSSVEATAVCRWRRSRFAEIATPVSANEQNAFHALAAPERPAFGVSMARADACTVSVTTIEVFASTIRMAYRALSGPGEAHVADLVRASDHDAKEAR